MEDFYYILYTYSNWFFIAFYVSIMGVLILGLLRLPFSKKQEDAQKLPTVSLVISARNEALVIEDCLHSLKKLNYPEGKLEIILVNDRSTDATGQIMEDFAASDTRMKVLHTKLLPENTLEGKAKGIAAGCSIAKGEWISISDADTVVHPDWLLHIYSDITPDIGLIGGALIVEPIGLLGKTERMSWALAQSFSLGLAGHGQSFVCVGPNMHLRKYIYDHTGGLENADIGVAEDLAIHKMVQNQGYKIKNYMDVPTSVTLKPVDSWFHLFSQHRRWLGGGLLDKQLKIPLIFIFGLGVLFGAHFYLGWLLRLDIYLLAITLITFINIILLKVQKWRLKQDTYVSLFWILTLYLPLVYFFLPLSFLYDKKIRWRGTNYTIEY